MSLTQKPPSSSFLFVLLSIFKRIYTTEEPINSLVKVPKRAVVSTYFDRYLAMKLITIIFLMAIIMASSITFIVKNITYEQEAKTSFELPSEEHTKKDIIMPMKRTSRFLVENKPKNPRAADHCNKENEICDLLGGYNSTCCNNKCVDLWVDDNNCGACKQKCGVMEACCGGKCVYLSYDKRNCGFCGNKCNKGSLCIYGICDYA